MTQKDTIIIVDDQELNRVILRNVLEDEYNLLEAENGEQALVLAGQYHDQVAVMLLDLIMPVKDGYEVLRALNENNMLSKFPVIVITAEDSAENEVRAFDLGASDIIMKPFEPYVVRRRVQNVVELNLRKLHQQEIIEAQAQKLLESNSIMIDALSSIIEYRSVETGQHIHRIRLFTKTLLTDVARVYPEFGLNDHKISMISSASSMHDIGKIAIPDQILNKPGKLTEHEYEIMKTHTTKGCEMLESLDRMGDREYLMYAYNICRYHHERWDGRGYPDGLKGDAIPVCAQVVGIADCYDALTSDRAYKKAFPPEKAYNMILNGECGVFSPKLLECLKNVQDEFTRLTREYSDHGGEKTVFEPKQPRLSFQKEDTAAMAQYKYFTLLRYMDATVVEMDCVQGLYHVVYLADPVFEPLKKGGNYWEAYAGFAVSNIRDDENVREASHIRQHMADFFKEGRLSSSRGYQVYSEKDQCLRYCEETWLRIDTENPLQSGIMVIFRLLDDNPRLVSHMESPSEKEIGVDRKLLAQARSLLGAIHTCRYDQWFTLVNVRWELANMLGYTVREINEKFHDRLTEMMYPADVEKVRRQISRQLKRGRVSEAEFRMAQKSGEILWVLSKGHLILGDGGDMYLQCTLVDITRSRKKQEELQKMAEQHQIILDQSNDIIMEWDMIKDTLSCSSNWEKKYGQPINGQLSPRQCLTSHIHPDDLIHLSALEDSLKSGESFAKIELRIADVTGRYRWSQLRATALKNEDGRPYKAVGLLADIDDQKRATQHLQEEAQRDGLTRLYNKTISRQMIETLLNDMAAEEKAVMFIIDMDNFKAINDTCGHMFGDIVLQEFSGDLVKLFRSDDVIARIGGDEFMVFMKNIPDESIVKARAKRIIKAASRTFKDNTGALKPSCSIGIAFYPKDGKNYEELFRRSDEALYDAKSQGKNTYVLYRRKRRPKDAGICYVPVRGAKNQIETQDPPEKLCSSMLESMLDCFYNSTDDVQCIKNVMAELGQQMDLSRVYIFEDSLDHTSVTNTFEWCGRGIQPKKRSFSDYSYDRFGGREHYMALFNDEGSFICPDIQMLPEYYHTLLAGGDIKSVFQCAIYDQGVFSGFIGFDDCRHTRFWTPQQIEAFSTAGKLLSVCVLRMRMKDKIDRIEKERKEK